MGGILSRVIRIGLERGANRFAPPVGAEGVYIFMLGELDGLHQGLAEIGEGGSGFGFDVSLSQGGENAAESGAEIAGGKVFAGEEMGDIAAEFLSGLGVGFFAGMEAAEVRMAGLARSAATAAIGEGERTQRYAMLGAESRHGSLLKCWI